MNSSPNPVRWGVLGTARIASKVAAAIRATPNAGLLAVASRTRERADSWKRQEHAARAYGDYQSLIDDDEVDAVYIPLPPSMHADWTIWAAERGKHVLCEKPLATSVAAAEEMCAACAENNVQLMDATMWMHHPRTKKMKAALGKLGKLRRVTTAFGFMIDAYLQNNPSHMSKQLSPGDPSKHELRFQRDLGGGSLLDLGWYCVRSALWAFDGLPNRVFGAARYQGGVDMSFNALMWYSDNRMASFDCGFDLGLRKWFEIVGAEGSLVCDDFLNPWDAERPRYWTHDNSGKAEENVTEGGCQIENMIARFCRIVSSGKLENRWPNLSLGTQRVCDALDRSARVSRVVDVE